MCIYQYFLLTKVSARVCYARNTVFDVLQRLKYLNNIYFTVPCDIPTRRSPHEKYAQYISSNIYVYTKNFHVEKFSCGKKHNVKSPRKNSPREKSPHQQTPKTVF